MGDDHFDSVEQIQVQPLLSAIRQLCWRIPFVVDQTGVEPVSKDRSNVLLLSYPVFQVPLGAEPPANTRFGYLLIRPYDWRKSYVVSCFHDAVSAGCRCPSGGERN